MASIDRIGLTPEELELRKQGLGASDSGAVAGVNPFWGPIDVWLEKTGKSEPRPMTKRMLLGHLAEPAIARSYVERVGATHAEKPRTMVHPTESWMLATPDLIAQIPDRPIRRAECKLVGFRVRHHWFDGEEPIVPDYVQCQAQWQGLVTGIPDCDVLAWIGEDDAQEDPIISCPFDPDLAQALMEIGREFWFEHVLKDIPPPPDASKSWTEYALSKWPKVRRPLTEAPEEAEAWAHQYIDAKAAEDEAQARKDEAKNHLIDLIGDHEGIRGLNFVAKWTNRRGSPRWKAVAEELGADDALVEKHRGPSTRAFTCEEL